MKKNFFTLSNRVLYRVAFYESLKKIVIEKNILIRDQALSSYFVKRGGNMSIVKFYLYLFYIFVSANILFASEFKFNDLAYEEGDPDTYTLSCLDSSLIPTSQKIDDLTERPDLNPIKDWINRKLFEKLKSDEKDVELRVDTRNFDGRNYYLVRLYTKRHAPASEHLATRLWGVDQDLSGNMEFASAMIIFPPGKENTNKNRVLAYLLGSNWSQLCNSYATINDWGLRIAASNTIFSDKSIKAIYGKNNFDPNPSTRKEKKQSLAPIESFALEVGTEGLLSLSLLPQYETGSRCMRLIEGGDTFKFSLAPPSKEERGSTIKALFSMAFYLYNIAQNEQRIHRKLRPFIDNEEINKETIALLNQRLTAILKDPKCAHIVFPVNLIWKVYGKSPFFPIKGKSKNKDFFKAIGSLNRLTDTIQIRKARSKTSSSESINRLIFTIPIYLEDREAFYRFDRGRWFKVDASRFSKIIELMRNPEVTISLPQLVDYTEKDAEKSVDVSKQKGVDYKEANYNKRIIRALGSKKGVLLDRINVSLGGAGNLFEFGDMLLCGDDEQFYIVHVKRKEAGNIDHHRTQVERCAEYLGTELKKDNAQDLLLKGLINGLYQQFGISINKVDGQKERLTHGTYFRDLKAKGKKETYKKYLERIFKTTQSKNKTHQEKLKNKLKEANLKFFENCIEELIILLDALYDCCEKREVSDKEINDFIEGAQQFIELKSILFPAGPIKGDIRKKISIVMAVIDDRKIDKILEAKKNVEQARNSKNKTVKKKSGKVITQKEAEAELKAARADKREEETALFHKQDLWGLDRTRQMVQKHGFRFNLVVINKNPRLNWDAFGPIDQEDEDDSDSEDTNDTNSDENTDSTSEDDKSSDSKHEDGEQTNSEGSDTQEVEEYRYTSTDINRLLHVPLSQVPSEEDLYERFSLTDGDDDDDAETVDIVHRLNNKRYVLPPIIGHRDEEEDKDAYDTLLDFWSESFFANVKILGNLPEEMIIPFNPGGHWVTFHILIPANGNITFKYIDSLTRIPEKEVRLLAAFLRGKYGKKVKVESVYARMQDDGVSCGAMAAENIKDLFQQTDLPNNTPINGLALKKQHREYLTSIGKDFDF